MSNKMFSSHLDLKGETDVATGLALTSCNESE